MNSQYRKYEDGQWASRRSWETEMRDVLVEELRNGTSTFDHALENAWQQTGIEFSETDADLWDAFKARQED